MGSLQALNLKLKMLIFFAHARQLCFLNLHFTQNSFFLLSLVVNVLHIRFELSLQFYVLLQYVHFVVLCCFDPYVLSVQDLVLFLQLLEIFEQWPLSWVHKRDFFVLHRDALISYSSLLIYGGLRVIQMT